MENSLDHHLDEYSAIFLISSHLLQTFCWYLIKFFKKLPKFSPKCRHSFITKSLDALSWIFAKFPRIFSQKHSQNLAKNFQSNWMNDFWTKLNNFNFTFSIISCKYPHVHPSWVYKGSPLNLESECVGWHSAIWQTSMVHIVSLTLKPFKCQFCGNLLLADLAFTGPPPLSFGVKRWKKLIITP